MKNMETKKLLLHTTIEMLNETEAPEEITARKIATRADVNLALINYYYGSKDALVNQAIEQILNTTAVEWKENVDDSLPPKDRIRQMLINLSDMVFKYATFTKHSVRYEILENEISIPYFILPFIREYYGNKKSEPELKFIAFQLISTMQLLFLKPREYFRYAGADISEKKTRDSLIEMQLDLLLNGGNNEQ